MERTKNSHEVSYSVSSEIAPTSSFSELLSDLDHDQELVLGFLTRKYVVIDDSKEYVVPCVTLCFRKYLKYQDKQTCEHCTKLNV